MSYVYVLRQLSIAVNVRKIKMMRAIVDLIWCRVKSGPAIRPTLSATIVIAIAIVASLPKMVSAQTTTAWTTTYPTNRRLDTITATTYDPTLKVNRSTSFTYNNPAAMGVGIYYFPQYLNCVDNTVFWTEEELVVAQTGVNPSYGEFTDGLAFEVYDQSAHVFVRDGFTLSSYASNLQYNPQITSAQSSAGVVTAIEQLQVSNQAPNGTNNYWVVLGAYDGSKGAWQKWSVSYPGTSATYSQPLALTTKSGMVCWVAMGVTGWSINGSYQFGAAIYDKAIHQWVIGWKNFRAIGGQQNTSINSTGTVATLANINGYYTLNYNAATHQFQ
jgi:hypothetical protein